MNYKDYLRRFNKKKKKHDMELFKLLMSAFIFCINLIHCNHEQYQDGRLSTFEPENIVVEINSFIFF